jgi:predicted ferric reductase
VVSRGYATTAAIHLFLLPGRIHPVDRHSGYRHDERLPACLPACLLLAVRPKWLEPHLRGLDKMYRLHKWLGITALVTSASHWWFAQGTKWMVGWGWVARPARRGDEGGHVELSGLVGWLHAQEHLAKNIGQWTFYFAAALMVLALVKLFPYYWFRKTHTWLAAGYLRLVYHGTVLAKPGYRAQPVGWAVAALMAAPYRGLSFWPSAAAPDAA